MNQVHRIEAVQSESVFLLPTPTPSSLLLALTLLVLGVLTDDANDATAMNHFALIANLLY